MLRKAFDYLRCWENWHWFVKYVFIGPAWLWFCLKARSFWFFTPSNPSIVFGGFTGETKREIYQQLPEGSYPKTIYVAPACSLSDVFHLIDVEGLSFPLAVKPDVGMMGYMFRVVESSEQLRQYHNVIPVNYLIQEFVSYPIEVSVFHYRFPYELSGRITGFVRKEFMEVVGDGKSSLRELIINYPRAQFRLQELLSKHENKLDRVIATGERFVLSQALNLSRGGKLISLEKHKDQRLLNVFDRLSHRCGFYYGRYDIRCNSIEELKRGLNFSILEYNGCGAEPHHVYGNNNSFLTACRILVEHWNVLYRISAYNRKKGLLPWRFSEGRRFVKLAKTHFAVLRQLDVEFEFDKKVKQTRASSDSSVDVLAANTNRTIA
jgi:hypothetical protein